MALYLSTLGLSTAQWSVTTATNRSETPTRITENVSRTFRGLFSSIALWTAAPGGERWVIREVSPNPGTSERLPTPAPRCPGRAGRPPAAAGLCQPARRGAINAHNEGSTRQSSAFQPVPTGLFWIPTSRAGGRSLRAAAATV